MVVGLLPQKPVLECSKYKGVHSNCRLQCLVILNISLPCLSPHLFFKKILLLVLFIYITVPIWFTADMRTVLQQDQGTVKKAIKFLHILFPLKKTFGLFFCFSNGSLSNLIQGESSCIFIHSKKLDLLLISYFDAMERKKKDHKIAPATTHELDSNDLLV